MGFSGRASALSVCPQLTGRPSAPPLLPVTAAAWIPEPTRELGALLKLVGLPAEASSLPLPVRSAARVERDDAADEEEKEDSDSELGSSDEEPPLPLRLVPDGAVDDVDARDGVNEVEAVKLFVLLDSIPGGMGTASREPDEK